VIHLILQTEIIWPYLSGFLTWVSESAGIFVIISGVIALSWLGFERKRRGSFFKRKSESESAISKSLRIILKIISYSGVIVGILNIWAGAMGLILDIPPSFAYRDLTANNADHFTCIFLIVVGIAMLFKPVKDLPLTSMLSLIAASATVFILALLVPDSVVTFITPWINPKFYCICYNGLRVSSRNFALGFRDKHIRKYTLNFSFSLFLFIDDRSKVIRQFLLLIELI